MNWYGVRTTSGTGHKPFPSQLSWIALGSFLAVAIGSGRLCAQPAGRTIRQYVHTAWSDRERAPAGITALAQGKDGYLWIGTPQGLYRFDGVTFELFEPQSGSPFQSRGILSLLALPNGQMWIGFHDGGVSLLQDRRNTNYGAAEGLPDGMVSSFAQGWDGTIWAATRTGLAHFQGGRWKRAQDDWNYPGKSAQSTYVDRKGTLWVATENTVVFLPLGATRFQPTGEKVGQVWQITESPQGELWIAETTRSVRPILLPGLDRSVAGPEVKVGSASVLFDHDGALWLTTIGDGMRRIPHPETFRGQTIPEFSDKIESFTAADGLSANFQRAILEDQEGNIWVGTAKGVDRFRKGALAPVELPNRISQTLSLVAGSQGRVYVGTLSGGVVRVGDGMWAEENPFSPHSACRDPSGPVWLAGTMDLLRMQDGHYALIPYPPGVTRPQIRAVVIACEPTGGVWGATEADGIFYLKNGLWSRPELPPALARLAPLAGFTDASGHIWFGYNSNTLLLVDGARLRTFSGDDGIVVGSVKAVGGRGSHVWLGGERGLNLFEDSHFHVITPEGGAFGGVSGIVETASDGLWLGEYRGVVHIPADEMRKVLQMPAYRVKYELFDSADGLPGPIRESTPTPIELQATDNKVWFATTNGVAYVDPERLPRNTLPPPVHVELVKIDGKETTPATGMVLSHRTKELEIDYTALSLSIPERVLFRYKLEGKDTEWHNVGPRRQAYYSSLEPRKYTFRVMACNNDGVWNEAGAAWSFTVTPAFYQTFWFEALCVLAGGLLLVGAYQLRIRQIATALNVRFDERLEERTRLAREFHDTLLQTIQASKMVADDALNHHSDATRMQHAMERLSEWLAQAIEEGRAALSSLRSSTTEQNDMAEALRRAGEECQFQRPIEFVLSVQGESREMHPIVRDEVYRIGYEAIRNACAHSEGSLLNVKLSYVGDLVLQVSDNGKGIAPELAAGGKGGHFGVTGMHERASRLHGRLTISGSPDSGTEVKLVVPDSIAFPQSGPNGPARYRGLRRFLRW